ncbi:MAG: hypothetical protein K0R52_372 [Alphaproteobacteria bacterium]|jgi:hypothetical protein|nr:hypothetical protein [Alphaproteobacteria bacterium]
MPGVKLFYCQLNLLLAISKGLLATFPYGTDEPILSRLSLIEDNFL